MNEIAWRPTATRVIPARLGAFGAETTPAVIAVTDLSPSARFARSVTALGVCWGAAAVAVVLPILHLVLVPSWLVGGVVAAVVLGRQAQRVMGVRGTCPRCRTEQELEAGGRIRRERIIVCPGCHTNVTLLVGENTVAEAARVEATRT